MQKLLQAWMSAIAEMECAEARAFCASPGARARALWEARRAERQAMRLARVLQTRYGINPEEKLRNGEIK